jgi:Ni/Fe-hydrogenase subunit HybB-like protein
MAVTLPKKIPFTLFHVWLLVLASLAAGGVVAGYIILTQGLWVTNLTDLVPWGLWITIDLSAIALSAGAFMLCAAVYLLKLKQYTPLARTATFIGLIGYSMAVLCLMLDIGRPDRFWHALVFWNTHSLLWEVTMCVTLYFSVLTIEVAPLFGETEWMQKRFPGISRRLVNLHSFAPYLAVAGLCFSMLHQSSLGATYGVLKARPFLFRPDLAVLFMVSAIAGGLSMTALVTMLAGRLNPRSYVDDRLVERLSYFIGWVLVGYLYFRAWDALAMTYTYSPGRSEGLKMLLNGPLAFNFWVFEIALGAVIPMVILLKEKFRRVPALRMAAAAFVVMGLVAYRWDINVGGQLVVLSYLPNEISAMYTQYVPSFIEVVAGVGIVAYGILAITLAVRYLNLVNHRQIDHHHPLEADAALHLAPGD